MKTVNQLLTTWDNATLRNTKRNYQNALTEYRLGEKDGNYKRMVEMIKMITLEIDRRINSIEDQKIIKSKFKQAGESSGFDMRGIK